MGEFRTGEESRIPYGGTIWFACIEYRDGKFINTAYNTTKGNVVELRNYLMDIVHNGKKAEVFAVWNGERRTDLFLIDPKIYLKTMNTRVSRLEKMTFKELQALEDQEMSDLRAYEWYKGSNMKMPVDIEERLKKKGFLPKQ